MVALEVYSDEGNELALEDKIVTDESIVDVAPTTHFAIDWVVTGIFLETIECVQGETIECFPITPIEWCRNEIEVID